MLKSCATLVAVLGGALMGCGTGEAPLPPPNVTVKAGESIQAAIDAMPMGATSWVVAVEPGVYKQTLSVIRANVELRGLATAPGFDATKRPILDGDNDPANKDAIQGYGANFTIRGLAVRNYAGNGIVVKKTKNVKMIDLDIDKTGAYGLYPVEMDGVLVEACRVTGAADAGIYVGQSTNATVRNNRVSQNVTGIEIENTVGAVVELNEATDNTAGLLAFVLPNNPSKVGKDCVFRRNKSYNNNHVNFGAPNATVAKVPVGLGVFIMAADSTTVTDNDIYGNDSTGVLVVGLGQFLKDTSMLDVDPNPDGTVIRGNRFMGNGTKPAKDIADAFGGKGADIAFDLMAAAHKICATEKEGTAFQPYAPDACSP